MTIARHTDDDSQDQDIIRLGPAWSVLLKVGLLLVPFAIAFGVWGVTNIFDHSARLRLLEYRLDHVAGHAGNNTNNLSIGSPTTSDADTSHKDFISTEDVAAKEKVTARTVINWINHGLIQPAPTKEGKSWVISENYRILPHSSENSGIAETTEKGDNLKP
jgi:hypothetical protein